MTGVLVQREKGSHRFPPPNSIANSAVRGAFQVECHTDTFPPCLHTSRGAGQPDSSTAERLLLDQGCPARNMVGSPCREQRPELISSGHVNSILGHTEKKSRHQLGRRC